MSCDRELPIQLVERAILCSPYDDPKGHWLYETGTGEAKRAGKRRSAGYC